MAKYVALLRGINVGGKNMVSMNALRAVFEELGFTGVVTYINSGNVVFSTTLKKPAQIVSRIEAAIETNFGFPVRVVVRDAQSIHVLCKAIPESFLENTEQRTYVLFLWDHYDSQATLKLISIQQGIDDVRYLPGAIVWNLARKHINRSGMRKFISTEVYKQMTARNITTVRKLGELLV